MSNIPPFLYLSLKGKKWYYHFNVEDASGNLVQKEYAGTESKSETQSFQDVSS